MDRELGLEVRVSDLLRRLSFDEKLSLCAGKGLFSTRPVGRLGIRSFRVTDGPHGVGALGSGFRKCTYFPSGVCRTATWNTQIAEEFGVALADEVRSIGCQMVLGPAVNIIRTPSIDRSPHEGLKERCNGRARLVANPAEADVVLVFVGFSHSLFKGTDTEGKDRSDPALPSSQVHLIMDTVRANPNTVVVLVNGSPVTMDGWLERVPAVVEAWYAGQEAGRAIASVLLGDVNPSGKLPVTFPKELSDSPAHASGRTFPGNGRVYYDEGVFVGYRHFDLRDIEPLFPFGHGLSYTSFSYDNLRLGAHTLKEDETVAVSVDVRNTGRRYGAEVVQLYLRDVEAGVERPLKELKGFRKVFLEPTQTTTATFTLSKRDLSFWDESAGSWVAESGAFQVLVGSSSRDIRLVAEMDYVG